MPYITLVSKEDNETGELGLIIKGMRVTNYPSVASTGLLIAHDLLEHQNGISAIGSISDELEALGGVWFVRGQHYDMDRGKPAYHTPETHLASDVSNMAELVCNGVPIRGFSKKTYKHFQDDAFIEIIELGRESYKSEMDCYEDSDFDPLNDYFSYCLHAMRKGYRKAEKRFNRVNANTLFWDIAGAVDPYASNVDYENQEFRLFYSADRVYCEEIYDYSEY